jgi:hypothetical protein
MFQDNGFVGIGGVTNPSGTLDVNAGTGQFYALQRGNANDASAKQQMTGVATNCTFWPASTGTTTYIYFRNGNTGYRGTIAGSMFFTGQHGNLPIDPDMKQNIEKYVGLIVSTVGTGCYSVNPITGRITTGKNAITISESLPIIKLTDRDKDKAVWGVVTNVKNDNYNTDGTVDYDNKTDWGDRLYNTIRINGLGEGAIWVININGSIENGDYICSSIIPGYGRKQDDDILHNYTVAKATIDCNFDINNNNLYECEEFEYEGQTYIKAFISCTYHCS